MLRLEDIPKEELNEMLKYKSLEEIKEGIEAVNNLSLDEAINLCRKMYVPFYELDSYYENYNKFPHEQMLR